MSICFMKKLHVQTPNFLCLLPMAVAQSSVDDSTMHYAFGFVMSCFNVVEHNARSRTELATLGHLAV